MALTKVVTHDCQVLENGVIQARIITRIMEDGKEIGKRYNRTTREHGADVTNEPEIWKAVALAVHTPERIAARQAFHAAQELRDNPVELDR